MTIHFFLPVTPRTKKNSSQIFQNKSTGKRFVMPSDAYRTFARDCTMLIPREHRNAQIDYPVTLATVFYMPTKRKVDLPNLISAIHDVLVGNGVLADDNSSIVYSVDGSRVHYRPEQPGIDVRIEGGRHGRKDSD